MISALYAAIFLTDGNDQQSLIDRHSSPTLHCVRVSPVGQSTFQCWHQSDRFVIKEVANCHLYLWLCCNNMLSPRPTQKNRRAEAPLCLSILPQPAVELVYMMYVYYHLCKEVVAVYCQPWYIFEHSDSWYWVNTLVSCSNVRGMCEVTRHHSGIYKLLSKVQSSRWIFGFFLDPTSKSFVPGWLKVFTFK